jgi:hypothetical protein
MDGVIIPAGTAPTTSQVLRATGSTTMAWGALDVAAASAVTGILPVEHGGTGASTLASDSLLTGNGTSAVQAETNLTYASDVLTLGGSGQIHNADGSVGSPAYSFTNDQNTGIYLSGTDELGLTTAGTLRLTVSSTGNLVPGSNNALDLGTDALAWKDLHMDGVIIPAGTSPTTSQVLRATGATTMAWGALDVAAASAVTGVLPVEHGGTGFSEKVFATYRKSSQQTLTNNTYSLITWDSTVTSDTNISESSGAITVDLAGRYLITSEISITSEGNPSTLTAFFTVDTTTTTTSVQHYGKIQRGITSGFAFEDNLTAIIDLTASQVVRFYAAYSGTVGTRSTPSATTNGFNMDFTITRLG